MDDLGILAHGDNHFIVRGRRPEAEEARAMARYWSVIEIGRAKPDAFGEWRMSTREFREELAWAVVVGAGEVSEAVAVLLGEMRARGVEVVVA